MAIDFEGGDAGRLTVSGSAINGLFAGGGTVMCWLIKEVTATGLVYIVDKGAGWTFRHQQVSGSNNRLNFTHGFSTTGGIWFTPFPADVPQGEWHHVAVSYDSDDVGNDPIFYLNGLVHGTEEAVIPVGTANADIGTANLGGTGGTSGEIICEDMRFYNRMTSDEEILTIANSRGVDGIVDGIVARWMMQEQHEGSSVPTTSGFIKDLSDSGLGATLSVADAEYQAGVLRTRRRVA